VKSIRQQIRKELAHSEYSLYDKSSVILGTPIGLLDENIEHFSFDTLFIDEAGQCLEPLAWCIIPFADRTILCGDHLQLPPTVLSDEALKKGYGKSILEQCYLKVEKVHLLDTQYRMRGTIVQFPNEQFYEGKLNTPAELLDGTENFFFFDTAGAGFEEEPGEDGSSLINQGEVEVIQKLLEKEGSSLKDVAIISPYSAQVTLIGENIDRSMRVSTIDSFQGQERSVIIISLVRSNDKGIIGFLKDYRRMNVAMTRAKDKLIIIGDSSTIGSDPFYASLLNYSEKIQAYRSVWEILY
jgi:superfamily I DNA and/or RNA helicase